MQNYYKLVLAGLILFGISSCKIMYIPNAQNVPMLEEKNDIKVNLGMKDLQVAYALTDNVGLMVNGFYKSNDWTLTSGDFENRYLSKRSLIEGGLGYYTTLGGNGRFDVYGGAGLGGFSYNYDLFDAGVLQDASTFNASMFRFFIQPSIGVQNENVGFAFSTRFAGINFSGIENVGYDELELRDEELFGLDQEGYMFLEPAISFRMGIKYAQLQLQPYYNLKIAGPALNTRNYGLNFSVYISIDDFFKATE